MDGRRSSNPHTVVIVMINLSRISSSWLEVSELIHVKYVEFNICVCFFLCVSLCVFVWCLYVCVVCVLDVRATWALSQYT